MIKTKTARGCKEYNIQYTKQVYPHRLVYGGSVIKTKRTSFSDNCINVDWFKRMKSISSMEIRGKGFCHLMINDIPRQGTGCLVIRMQQSIIIQLNIYTLCLQTAAHLLCMVIV